MSIESVLINVADVRRSVDFYLKHLDARLIGAMSEESATLDLVTATIRLSRVDALQPSTWKGDDLQRGFRHLGFKVADVDDRVARLKADGVAFHLDPLDAEGGVRISFFFDPDGTLLEFVQGDLQYHFVADADGVAAERGLGIPERPRFDHIAVTVDDRDVTESHYRGLGFGDIGTINQPNDPRGYEIHYLKAGDSVLEVFTYEVEKEYRLPQLVSPGFVAASLGDAAPPAWATPVGVDASGEPVFSDSDGFLFTVGGARE
jgi:catechol 2,3-dioxygenase-like lactoylglutathione lyase family enzyme